MIRLLTILFLALATVANAQPRIITATATRPTTAAPSLSLFRANPVTLNVKLDATRPTLTGVESLNVEIRRSVTDTTTALARTTIEAPEGAGPFALELSGAQMNQSLGGASSASFWMVAYTLDDAGEALDVLWTAPLTIREHGASLTAAAPPNVVSALSVTAADLLYQRLDTVAPLSIMPILDPTAHAANQIDNRIAGVTANDASKQIFSTATHTGTPAYVRSTTCWAKDIDLTGIGVWNSQYGVQIGFTAITPRHVVICHHATIANGTTLRWVTAGNVILERTLTNSTQIGSTDIRVGVLSADLPATIKPCAILPANHADYLTLEGLPVLSTDQEKKAVISQITAPAAISFEAGSGARAAFFEGAVGGDSGNPLAIIVEDSAVLVTMYYSAVIGPNLSANFTAIQAAANSLEPGYTLPVVDLGQPKISYFNLTDTPSLSDFTWITDGAIDAGRILVAGPQGNLHIGVEYDTTSALVATNNEGAATVSLIPSGGAAGMSIVQSASSTIATGSGAAHFIFSSAGEKLRIDNDGRLTWTETAAKTATRASLGLGTLATLNAAEAGTLTGSTLAVGVNTASISSLTGNLALAGTQTIGPSVFTSVNPATTLNLGARFGSGPAGSLAQVKLRIYDDGASVYGLGVSSGVMDYYAAAAGLHAFGVGGSRVGSIGTSGITVNTGVLNIATAKTPASATAAGTTGDICWDTNYIYVCTATNTWKRTAISTW